MSLRRMISCASFSKTTICAAFSGEDLQAAAGDLDHTFVVGVDDLPRVHLDAADVNRLVHSRDRERAVVDGQASRIGREGNAHQPGNVPDPAVGHEGAATGGVERLGHPVAENALVLRPGTDRLAHPHRRLLHLVDPVHHLPESAQIRLPSRRAAVQLAGHGHAHVRPQRRGDRLNGARHVELFGRSRIDESDGVGQQRRVVFDEAVQSLDQGHDLLRWDPSFSAAGPV